MEVVIGLLLVVAVPIVLLGAKRGAEAAQREREGRWSNVPAPPAVGRHAPGAARAATASRDRAGGAGVAHRRGPALADTDAVRRIRSALAARRASARRPKASAPPSGDRTAPGGEPPPRPAAGRERAGSSGAGLAVAPRPAGPPIDINTASVEELRNLPGVGVRAAQRIVAHRERYGRFPSIDDLEAVEGFDRHRVSRLAPRAKA